MTRLLLATAFASFALLTPMTARVAGATAPSDDWDRTIIVIEALTDFPLDVGGRVSIDVPYGIRLATGLSGIPSGYLDISNAILVDAGVYTQPTADLITATLESSLLWRTQVGWRWPGIGLVVEVGYGLATLGGGLTGEEAYASATGRPAPEAASGRLEYLAESMTHLVVAEVGWMGFFLSERLTVRATLGVAAVVASDVKVTPDFTVRPAAQARVDEFVRFSESYLEAQLETVITPTITLAIGFRAL